MSSQKFQKKYGVQWPRIRQNKGNLASFINIYIYIYQRQLLQNWTKCNAYAGVDGKHGEVSGESKTLVWGKKNGSKMSPSKRPLRNKEKIAICKV